MVVVAAVGTGIVQWRALSAERAAEAAFPPEGQIVHVRGTRIHAVTLGSGPDVVLIHGAGGNVRDFTFEFAQRLSETYRVIVLDRPGFGYSDPPPDGVGTLEFQARALQGAAAALGARSPLVMGHSYGGAVAMAWAVHMPETISALVLEAAPVLEWPGGVDRLYEVTGTTAGGLFIVPVLTAFVTPGYVNRAIAAAFAPQDAPNGYAEHIGGALTLRRTTMRINARQRLSLKDELIALSASYPKVTIPVEILHGDADVTVSLSIHAEPLHEMLPDSNLTVLPGVGHMLHNTMPAKVAAAVDRAAARAGLR